MTIKVRIENQEAALDEKGNRRYATLKVTIVEASVVNGEVKETRRTDEIPAACETTFYVYSARSILLEASNKP